MRMANELNTGASKLVERILEDAKKDAAKLELETNARLDEIRLDCEKRIDKRRDELTKATAAAQKSILERSRTNAELEARKQALASRREIVDEAFATAYKDLCGLSGPERAQVCRKMLLAEADGGETVCGGSADHEALMELLPEVNEALEAAGKRPLTAGAAENDMEYGFVLKGDGYEKDCSFSALIRDARAVEETAVAGILFD